MLILNKYDSHYTVTETAIPGMRLTYSKCHHFVQINDEPIQFTSEGAKAWLKEKI